VSTWAAQIEEDLKWREAELGSLKLAAASAPKGGDRERALLRALWTMLYAHYEGFSKFCWDVLLDQIEKDGCVRSAAIEPITIFSLAKVFKEARGDLSAEGIWKFVGKTFPNAMEQPVTFSTRLETRSNLWPSIANENNACMGLDCKQIGIHEAQLRALVGRRNDIAHGKKLIVSTLLEYEVYEKAVMIVLHELAVAVVEQLTNKKFIKGPPNEGGSVQLELL
jgi:hypothetical protein